jgi:formylglycine-generating enzyme required for sulfatase activity
MSRLTKRMCLSATWAVIAAALLSGGVQPPASGQGAGRPTPTPRMGTRRTPRTETRRTPTPEPRPTPVPTPRSAPQIEMVLVPGGTFMMGSPESNETLIEETPQHSVTVRSFYVSKYEVTQAQWRAVMGTNPSINKGDNLPVDNVTWYAAVEFCRQLRYLTGEFYRLPTEAEWEYACRAGGTGDVRDAMDSVAWYDGNSGDATHPVGGKQPNGFGLYDMHGNVQEWVEDVQHDNYYGAPADGSAWTLGGDRNRRVARGTSYIDSGRTPLLRSRFRCAYRYYWYQPDADDHTLGFRVAFDARP